MESPERSETRTAPTREHLAVGTVFDAVDRAVVPFEQFSLLAVQVMHPNPLITNAPGDETILQDRVD